MASILLSCQISIMASYPFVNEGEQKQDVLYRDNANSGVIMEENALQRNASSSDQRNGTLSSFLSLLPARARVARNSHPCINSTAVVLCSGKPILKVSCRRTSPACGSGDVPGCAEIRTICINNGKPTVLVTGCKCE